MHALIASHLCCLARVARTPQHAFFAHGGGAYGCSTWITDELRARMVGLDDERHQDVYSGQR